MAKQINYYNVYVAFDGENVLFLQTSKPVDGEHVFATYTEARNRGMELCAIEQQEIIAKLEKEKVRVLAMTEDEAFRSSQQFS